ncbi:hypothetical protein NW762_011557 [Fusarium torreyae]|uniref:L-lactate dehydrogenase (cytochrome) n=1 Tax=Fusarium torreyae TaxID=1237075 RepID=A0A9W8RT18_9HYPO|nr:hypothetical protein NW762_011557 [Fusarium torreyae]
MSLLGGCEALLSNSPTCQIPLTQSRRDRHRAWKSGFNHAFVTTALLLGVVSVSTVFKTSYTSKFTNPNAEDTTENNAIPFCEVQKHTSADDCWVVINGLVYDMTDFLQLHPGGANAILAKAGRDVSRLFTSLHAPTALDTLPSEYCLGPVDPATLPEEEVNEMTEDDIERVDARESMPHVNDMLLVGDFEHWAEQVLSRVAWAYYRSASDHEISFHENSDALKRYFFRPRILRGTLRGATNTSILGIPVSMPVMISPAAMAKLGHPLGEVNLTRAAGSEGIIQMISTDASCGLEEIFEAKKGDQPLFYQVYLNKDRKQSQVKIQMADRLGAKAIVLTVDVMRQSKRTLDVREKHLANPTPKDFDAQKSSSIFEAKGISESIAGSHDFNLSWKDVDFIRENTQLPIILKGVQCVEDVQLCVDHGVQGVILSNHGGRQADCAPAPIDVLYELRVSRPDLFEQIEIMVDGGFRSGADVVKALALGAKAVGMGRPFLYANGTHGEEGVSRVLQILRQEITNTMSNIGASTVEDLKPEMVRPRGPWVTQPDSLSK